MIRGSLYHGCMRPLVLTLLFLHPLLFLSLMQVSEWFDENWQPFLNANDIEEFQVLLKSAVNKVRDASVNSKERTNGYEEEDSENIKSRILLSLRSELRFITERVLKILRNSNELHGSDATEKIARQLDCIMFGATKADKNESILLQLLQIAEDESVNEKGEGTMKWKQRVWTLEEKVDTLQQELRKVRTESEERFKEMNATFDFWAKLVLSELRNQNATQTSSLSELNSRTSRLEECCIGINEGRSCLEEHIVDDTDGLEEQNETEDPRDSFDVDKDRVIGVKREQECEGSNIWVNQQTASQSIGLGGSASNNNCNRVSHSKMQVEVLRKDSGVQLSARNTELSVEGEDRELMQAFKKALGSHFTADPNPKCKARIFKDGHWTTLKRQDQGMSH